MMKLKPKEIVLFVLTFFILILIFLGIGAFIYTGRFAKAAGMKRGQVISQVRQGLFQPVEDKQLSLLVLGLDKREHNNSMLTDTMMVTTINRQTGDYLLFSLPRDLYLNDLKTKINALYYYGNKQNAQQPTKLPKQRIEQILNTEIDYTITLTMEDIKELIDFLGGVKVKVEQSFTDEDFPKDDGSGEVMTVSFKKGTHTFDGEKALQYMRSRKSENGNENTDIARQERQKQVLMALKSKLLNSQGIATQPKRLGELYTFVQERFDLYPQLNLQEITAIAKGSLKLIGGKQVEAELPWHPDNENRILVDTYEPVYGTWILIPKDNNWETISNYYHQQLEKINQ
jgi:LCP family protein required for cell wall assembly